MEIIIHIGPHKTGSTFLQQKLYINRELLSKNSIYYSADSKWLSQFGHHNIVEDNNYDYFMLSLKQLISDIPENGKILISSENFDRWENEKIKKFIPSILAPVHIVYFYRKSLTKFYSFWQEDIKHGSTVDFSTFILHHIMEPHKSRILNPSIILDNWSINELNFKLSIIDYDHTVENKKNIATVFMDKILNEEISLDLNNNLINKSLELNVTELLRALNVVHNSYDRCDFVDLRSKYLIKIKSSSEIKNLLDVIDSQTNLLNFNSVLKPLENLHKDFESKYLEYFKTEISQTSMQFAQKLVSPNWVLGNESRINKLYEMVVND